MKIVYNSILPTKGFSAMNLFGVMFVRKGVTLNEELCNHEAIHSAQIKELFVVFFYVFYFLEWLVKLFIYGKKSYYNISFEREAFSNDGNLDYLRHRKKYSFIKRIRS
jgi:hypothetical protein